MGLWWMFLPDVRSVYKMHGYCRKDNLWIILEILLDDYVLNPKVVLQVVCVKLIVNSYPIGLYWNKYNQVGMQSMKIISTFTPVVFIDV